ncbi:MAG: 16S rRNA processing protein RimM [Alistipes sp.]|nr:16S rRNA processing protein RimM [Alistipes sp.]
MEAVAAGKITRPFGKEGEVTAVLYDTFPARYDTREPLHVCIDGLAVPLFISRFERRGRRGALFVFDDIDSPERASLVTGLEFFIRADLAENAAPEGSLLEFVGYTAVVAQEGSDTPPVTGIVDSIEGNDSNPLFHIKAAGRGILVPASEDMVEGIDPEKRIIRLAVPEGLLDL